jgi:phenylalanyl-tRNA synthetase beta chain
MFDEDILEKIQFSPKKSLNIKNPVSSRAYRLATSLIPGLLKNIETNYHKAEDLRFFEQAKTWTFENEKQQEPEKDFAENNIVAGICFSKQGTVDFFDNKELLEQLILSSGHSDLRFVKTEKVSDFTWIHPFQTAEIFLNNEKIGYAGMINPRTFTSLGFLPSCNGFAFEFQLDAMYGFSFKTKQHTPSLKHQSSYFDVSVIIPNHLEIKKLEKEVAALDPQIIKTQLIDFFEKKEWADKRSVAFRVTLGNENKTLSKDEISYVNEKVNKMLSQLGGSIRE